MLTRGRKFLLLVGRDGHVGALRRHVHGLGHVLLAQSAGNLLSNNVPALLGSQQVMHALLLVVSNHGDSLNEESE